MNSTFKDVIIVSEMADCSKMTFQKLRKVVNECIFTIRIQGHYTLRGIAPKVIPDQIMLSALILKKKHLILRAKKFITAKSVRKKEMKR